VLAAHIANRRSPWGKIAVAACFETGKLPRSYFAVMKSVGIDLIEDQPPSVFERFGAGEIYDRVVVICNQQRGEQCAILGLSLRELYGQAQIENWSISDFSQVEGGFDEMRQEIICAVAALEQRVDQLFARIDGQEPVSQNNEFAQGTNQL
jgi:protein-tyrosine-phosphatase